MFYSKKAIASFAAIFVIVAAGVTARNAEAAVDRKACPNNTPQVNDVVEMRSEARAIVENMNSAIELLTMENPTNKDKANILKHVKSVQKKLSARIKKVNRVRKEIAGMMVAQGVCQDMKSALEHMDNTFKIPVRAEGEYIGDKIDAVAVSLENSMNPKLSEIIREQSFKNAGVWLYDVKERTLFFLFMSEKIEEVLELTRAKAGGRASLYLYINRHLSKKMIQLPACRPLTNSARPT